MKTNQSNSHSRSSKSNSSSTATSRSTKRLPPVAERVTAGATAAPAVVTATPSGTSSTPASPTTPVAAPPAATIPPVPVGFVPVSAVELRGFRALASQVAALPDAIAELQGFANYVAVFGMTAPDVGQLTARLEVASAWTTLLSQTAAFHVYVKSEQGLAWKEAFLLVEALRTPFALAAAANGALLAQYPGLARLLGAKADIAKRAAASRAKKKKAGTPATAQAPAAPVTTAPATTTGAASAGAVAASPGGGVLPSPSGK